VFEGNVEAKTQKGKQNLDREGEGILAELLCSLSWWWNETPRPIFICKKMVIWFGDGIKWVKWLFDLGMGYNGTNSLQLLEVNKKFLVSISLM
jgi:hypothetical protein